MKTKFKLLTILCFSFTICLTMAFAVSCKSGGKKDPTSDTTKPVITVENVPSEVLLGREVTFPAATAVDETDGDLTASVKLTVEGLDDAGESKKSFLYNATANKANVCTLKTYTNIRATYFVKDAAGNRGEKVFNITATGDTLAPVITITESDFSLETGVSGSVKEGYVIPSCTGIDQPGDLDITQNIKVTVYKEETNVDNYEYGDQKHYLIAGNYTIKLTLKDGSANEAEEIEFPLTIEESELEGNLLSTESIAIGHDCKFNDYGELVVGKTSEHSDDNVSSAAFRFAKIEDQYVAITINVDPKAEVGGENFYDISFVYSNNNTAYTPTGTEGQWAPYFVLRLDSANTMLRSATAGDGATAGGKAATVGLRDGKDHTLYFKFVKSGANAQASDAKIYIKVWIDAVPNSEEPYIDAYVFASDATRDGGAFDRTIFEDVWSNHEGWLAFGGYTEQNNNYSDDAMRVKGIALYSADATQFNTDILPPVVNVNGSIQTRYDINQEVTFPSATATDVIDGDCNVKIYLLKPDGTKIDLDSNLKYKLNVIGQWKIVYSAIDNAGNLGYAEYIFDVKKVDSVAPELTLSNETTINTNINTSFTIPTATAIDDFDGDISSKVILNVIGPDYNENAFEDGIVTEYTLMAVGTYTFRYISKDDYGNTSIKDITVNVTGGKEGNILADFSGYDSTDDEVILSSGTRSSYTEQKVYEEKVSMIVNVKDNSGLFFINLAGEIGSNADWPKGIVARFTASGIDISAQGHDGQIFGYMENPFNVNYNKNQDVLLEYQVKRITVANEDYVWVRLWFGETELTVTGTVNNGIKYGDLVADTTDGGVCLKISDFTTKNNRYAGYPHFVSYNGYNLVIKELRIDGSEMTKEWIVPDAGTQTVIELPTISETTSTSLVENTITSVPGEKEGSLKQISTALSAISTGKVTQLQSTRFSCTFVPHTAGDTLNFNSGTAYASIFLAGAPTGQWSQGLTLKFYKSYCNWISVNVNGNDVTWIPWKNGSDINDDKATDPLYDAVFSGNKFYIDYSIAYIKNTSDSLESIALTINFGYISENSIVWIPCEYLWNDGVTNEGNTLYIPESKFASSAQYTSNGVYFKSLGNTDDGNPYTGNSANYDMVCDYCEIFGVQVPDLSKNSGAKNYEGDSITVGAGDRNNASTNAGCQKITTAQEAETSSKTQTVLKSVTFAVQLVLKDGETKYSIQNNQMFIKLLGSESDNIWGATNGVSLKFYHYGDYALDNYRNTDINWLILVVNGKEAAWLNLDDSDSASITEGLETGKKVYIKYTIAYNSVNNNLTDITVSLQFGIEEDSLLWKNAKWYWEGTGVTISESGEDITIPLDWFSSDTQYTPDGINLIIFGNTDDGHDNASFSVVVSNVIVGDSN